jgi:DUF4097 and DUF4098 domain-containing protein YvlB
MREEILRISKMVEEGKLTAEEAAELIDAITIGAQEAEEAKEEPSESKARKDSFDTLFEAIDRTTRDVMDRVNWPEIAEKIRTASRTGWERVKADLEQIGKGEWRGIFGGHVEVKKQEIPLSIGAGGVFHAEIIRGDVKVVGGSAEPKVMAVADIRGRDEEDAKKRAAAWTMMVEGEGGDVTLRIPGQSAGAVKVDLEVHLPEGTGVDLKATSGDMSIKGTKGSVRLQGTSGDLTIEDAAERVWVQTTSGDVTAKSVLGGQVTIESKSGDISLSDCKASINARTASGDLQMTNIAGPIVALETISGDIAAAMSEPFTGKCSLRSVSGDISAAVPDGSSCRVALSSISGDVSCTLPLQDEIKGERRVTGMCGGGEGTFDASAISGDVALEMKSSN